MKKRGSDLLYRKMIAIVFAQVVVGRTGYSHVDDLIVHPVQRVNAVFLKDLIHYLVAPGVSQETRASLPGRSDASTHNPFQLTIHDTRFATPSSVLREISTESQSRWYGSHLLRPLLRRLQRRSSLCPDSARFFPRPRRSLL